MSQALDLARAQAQAQVLAQAQAQALDQAQALALALALLWLRLRLRLCRLWLNQSLTASDCADCGMNVSRAAVFIGLWLIWGYRFSLRTVTCFLSKTFTETGF